MGMITIGHRKPVALVRSGTASQAHFAGHRPGCPHCGELLSTDPVQHPVVHEVRGPQTKQCLLIAQGSHATITTNSELDGLVDQDTPD